MKILKNSNKHNSARQQLSARNGYQFLEFGENLDTIYQSIVELQDTVSALTREVKEIQLLKLESLNKDYLTPDDLDKNFGLSKRLQQDERTLGKLPFLKKGDGSKILYTVEGFRIYIKENFIAFNSKK